MAENQITVGILLELMNDKQVQSRIKGIVQSNEDFANSIDKVTTAEKSLEKQEGKTASAVAKHGKELKKAENVSKSYTIQKDKEGKAIGAVETVVRKQTEAGKTLTKVTERNNITDSKRIATIMKASGASEAHAEKIKEQVDASQNLTLMQKLMQGQWETAIPALNKVNNLLNTLRWSMVNVAFGAAAIAGAVAPFVLLTKQALDLELQLKRISAITGDFKSRTGESELASMLIQSRRGTPFSTNEAADAFLEISKAGFTAAEATEILPEAMELAIGGFTDLKEAAEILTTTLHAFEIQGYEAREAMIIIQNAANKSALDVETFGTSLSFVGPIAAELGFTLEETAASLAILSNAGLRGSKAGTTLRQVLNSIASPSKEAKDTMNALGITFFNVDGTTKDLASSIRALQIALSGLDDETRAAVLGDLFQIRSRTGVAAFMNASADEISQAASTMTEDVGVAAQIMEADLNKISDSVENLKDAFRGIGEFLADEFNPFVKILNKTSGLLADSSDFQRIMAEFFSEGRQGFAREAVFSLISSLFGGDNIEQESKDVGDKIARNIVRSFTSIDQILSGAGFGLGSESIGRSPLFFSEGDMTEAVSNARNSMDEVGRIIDEFVSRDTPVFNKLFDTFLNPENIGSVGQIIERVVNNLNKFGLAGDTSVIDNFNNDINALLENVKESEITISELNDKQTKLNATIKRLGVEVRDANTNLKLYKDQLSAVNEEISLLSNKRFEMETDFDKVIQAQREVILEQKLSALGITDVEQFIRDSIRQTGEEYDGVVDSIERVTETARNSKNEFKAWQTTVKEHIRQLIDGSQDLARDTTQAVEAHKTLLLSTSQFSQQAAGGPTQSERQLELLQLARDSFFGSQRAQVDLFLQAEQDRTSGVASGANEVINALEREFEKRDKLQNKVQGAQEVYDALNERLNVARNQHQELAIAIDAERTAIDRMNDSLAETAIRYQKLIAQQGNLNIGGGSRSLSDTEVRGFSTSETFASPGFRDLADKHGITVDDFIMRPNQPPIRMNPNDTLIGFKGDSPFGEQFTINVTVNGSGMDAHRQAEMIAQTVKRELRTR